METDELPQLETGTVACRHCGTQVERGAFACPGCHQTTLPTRRKWRAGDGRIVAISLAIALFVHSSSLFIHVVGTISESTGHYRVALWCAQQDLESAGMYCRNNVWCLTCQMEIMQEHHERILRIEQKLHSDRVSVPDRTAE